MAPPSTEQRQVRVVVIGGMGAGKSTVAAIFGALGAEVIEADRIGHAVLEPGGHAFDDVAARWPMTVRSGVIDRRALAAIVFSDTDQLEELEAFTHPHIAAEILRRADAASPRPVVVELPLARDLLGPGWVRVVVEADAEIRRGRAVARGFAPDDVAARLAAQPERDAWLAAADHVIINGGDLADLEERARTVWGEIMAAATA